MRPRNRELHADVERICDLKEQLKTYMDAALCHTTVATVRVLVCREMQRRKLTSVKFPMKLNDAKIGT